MVHLSQFYRSLIKSLGCFVFAAAVSQCAVAQIDEVEKHIPASGVKTVALEFSGTGISATIQVWDRDEVYIVGASNDKDFDENNIRVKAGKDSLNIEGGGSFDESIYLMIFIPAKSTLIIKMQGTRIQVREPQGTIRFWGPYIGLEVPETTTIDRRNANKINEHDRPEQPVTYDQKPPPKGAPYLTVLDVKRDIAVYRSRVCNQSSPRPFSNGAQSIARRNGPLAKPQPQSGPPLKSQDAAKPPARTSAEEKADVKLQTQMVVLNTSVTDREGRAISNLKQTDFRIYEDDVLQQTASFSHEKLPFNLVLLIDMSSSIGRPSSRVDAYKDGALHFLDLIGPNDKVAVLTYSHDINVVSHLSNDRQALRAAVELITEPQRGSVFYDGLGNAVSEELAGVKGQRNAVVILGDGQDIALGGSEDAPRNQPLPFNLGRGSLLTFKQLLDGVLEADVMIYSIHLECQTGMVDYAMRLIDTAREQMKELSTATGGGYFNPCNLEDMKAACDRVAAELQTVYTLSYAPRNQTLDGKFRAIKVVVEHENNTNYVTRSRRGYYAK